MAIQKDGIFWGRRVRGFAPDIRKRIVIRAVRERDSTQSTFKRVVISAWQKCKVADLAEVTVELDI